ncbi:hypothetical protein AVEN_50617-1 [Araneus ventricosus]|uniref:Uncharacterized protein n=1 Tax=Araneus ventricosus TaxID=182803 RepID=A0A4Y2AQL1_ARAVE|nr:hypothetical protein AVEN_50617-1 [Araneus ventricosus]
MHSDNSGKSEHAPTLVVIFMQDGAPPHFYHEVQQYLNDTILTPCDFYLWVYIKDSVYVPLMPVIQQYLQDRIVSTAIAISRNQLRMWQEMDYRFDVCRITNGAHVECIK